MDLAELAPLKQVELVAPHDPEVSAVVARDRATGRLFVLPAKLANAVRRLRHARKAEDSDMLAVGGLLSSLQALRHADRLQKKPFNPVFVTLPLFELAPLQPALTGLARTWVSWRYFALLGLLACVALVLGASNDWAVLDAFRNIFSLQALITFGLVAPFLKLFHELGHMVVATRYGVRLRKGGLFLIALFPIPFVDCTEADVTANRMQRIWISLAGLLADILLGLVFFIAWHLVSGEVLRALFGNIFVFLTLNSLLFNANPLIKLDGYFALVDLLRQRNLATEGTMHLRGLAQKIGSGGRQGAWPQGWRPARATLYALLSLLYRFNVIAVIALALLPRYLGLGAVLAVWGAAVMVLAPLQRQSMGPSKASAEGRMALWTFRLGLLALIGLALAFVRVPVRQSLPLLLDTSGAYSVTLTEEARLLEHASAGMQAAGAPLASFEFRALREEQIANATQLALARVEYDQARGADPARAATTLDRVESLTQQSATLQKRLAAETLSAPYAGLFVPEASLRAGLAFSAGDRLGLLLPPEGDSQLSGPFPERHVSRLRQNLEGVELRVDQTYLSLEPSRVSLREEISFDRDSGKRLYTLQLTAPLPPVQMAQTGAVVRLSYGQETLWARLRYGFDGVVQNFRDARLAEIDRRLEAQN